MVAKGKLERMLCSVTIFLFPSFAGVMTWVMIAKRTSWERSSRRTMFFFRGRLSGAKE